MSAPGRDLLEECRAALRSGGVRSARRALQRLLGDPQSANVLEVRTQGAYLELDFPATAEPRERTYADHRPGGDPAGA